MYFNGTVVQNWLWKQAFAAGGDCWTACAAENVLHAAIGVISFVEASSRERENEHWKIDVSYCHTGENGGFQPVKKTGQGILTIAIRYRIIYSKFTIVILGEITLHTKTRHDALWYLVSVG